MITTVLINGEPSPGLVPVTDSAVVRGDGCFEVLRVYGKEPFALDAHLERLEQSAAAVEVALPPSSELGDWVDSVSTELGDGLVRVLVTRGAAVPGVDDDPRVIVFGHTFEPPPSPARLEPVEAPWHAAGVPWQLSGAKLLSYAPNMAASRQARRAGADDAMLVSTSGPILEGPTFSVAWVVDGRLETPGLGLGILDSITRRLVLEDGRDAGIDVVEGVWDLSRLEAATEVLAMSTVREVQPVGQVGTLRFGPGPVTGRLSEAFARRHP